jgi:sugar phosphate isomerase/epimerase
MFRIGTTSYILPADILPNVEYLAPLVDDVELVLFETDEYGSNLPDPATTARLRELASGHDLTYTVHLPLDLRLGEPGPDLDVSLRKARRVIETTQALAPYAYVLHLDGRPLQQPGLTPSELAGWQAASRAALETVAGWLEEPRLLSVENLEAWDPDAFAPLVEALPVSRTIDTGHFWLMHDDPLPHLAQWIDRTRVIHLHGIAQRDHASLATIEPARLDPVVAFLVDHFEGVVTLEVFNEADFEASLAALRAAMARCQHDGARDRGKA